MNSEIRLPCITYTIINRSKYMILSCMYRFLVVLTVPLSIVLQEGFIACIHHLFGSLFCGSMNTHVYQSPLICCIACVQAHFVIN